MELYSICSGICKCIETKRDTHLSNPQRLRIPRGLKIMYYDAALFIKFHGVGIKK